MQGRVFISEPQNQSIHEAVDAPLIIELQRVRCVAKHVVRGSGVTSYYVMYAIVFCSTSDTVFGGGFFWLCSAV